MANILFLNTAEADCYVKIQITDHQQEFSWSAGRNLSDGLLKFLQQCLSNCNLEWADLSGVVVFRGPGSYTSLRIGLTVANTLADGLNIPIVGTDGETWQADGLDRLAAGDNDQIVLPIYLQPVHITQPKK